LESPAPDTGEGSTPPRAEAGCEICRVQAVQFQSEPSLGEGQALTEAAGSGFTSVVDLLIRNGADVNMAFADGRTPLCCAVESGHSDVVALLIALGANVNAEANGRTALKVARKRGNQGIIDLLLEHGARG
jgi:ankyrin repeat protein